MEIEQGSDQRNKDFSGADFSGMALRGVDFSGSNLSGANFWGAIFADTNFFGADLSGANFSGARFEGGPSYGFADISANFQQANLTGTIFSNEYPGNPGHEHIHSSVNFLNSNFSDAQLNGAVFYRSSFDPEDLDISVHLYSYAHSNILSDYIQNFAISAGPTNGNYTASFSISEDYFNHKERGDLTGSITLGDRLVFHFMDAEKELEFSAAHDLSNFTSNEPIALTGQLPGYFTGNEIWLHRVSIENPGEDPPVSSANGGMNPIDTLPDWYVDQGFIAPLGTLDFFPNSESDALILRSLRLVKQTSVKPSFHIYYRTGSSILLIAITGCRAL